MMGETSLFPLGTRSAIRKRSMEQQERASGGANHQPSKQERPERIAIGGVPLDVVSLEGALDQIERLVRAGQGGTVFTPNVDHVVLSQHNPRFRAAYAAASLSLVDGMPVLWASRLLGHPLPCKISGSDLVRPLLVRAAKNQLRVYFLGGDPGVAALAKTALERELPGVQIVGIDDPRIDVDSVPEELLQRIRDAKPDLVLVALGAPKQEIFSHEQREALKPAVLLGIGASLDFIAGARKRAPAWISSAGLEWLYRLAQEPRRLAGRYLLRDPQFLWIVGRQLARGKSAQEG
jgi:N-acetylglucosaminyldiphosphoundecaprenol N-acetyl-beta-D-mannosaminyltransferase